MRTSTLPIPAGGSLRDIGRLILPFWISEQKWKAFALLAFLLGNIAVNTYIAVWHNKWTGAFMQAITQYDKSAIPALLLQFGYILLVTTVAAVLHTFAYSGLRLLWRRWLTGFFLDRWFTGDTYYRIERERLVDNPDQRISEDVQQFVTLSFQLIIGLISVLASLGTFTVILWRLSGSLDATVFGHHWTIPGYMVPIAFLYAFGTSLLTQLIGRKLMPLTYRQQRVEADFRFKMASAREHAEQIALYNGARTENNRMKSAFAGIWENSWRIIRFTLRFEPYTNILGFVAFVVPLIVALPRYFAHAIDFGTMTRMGSAFTTTNNALSWFVNNYSQLQEYRAVAARLTELNQATKADDRASGLVLKKTNVAQLKVDNLTLLTPDGRHLTDGLTFSVAGGERWLLRGNSGVGKSTLMRALAGIWPYGAGAITLPEHAKLLFLPQKSYVPTGSLKAALCYPSDENAFSSADCHNALTDCLLSGYVGRLDEVQRWGQIMSPGEQQRLAIAGALLQKPDYLLLDESTNAVDTATEGLLYELLISRLPNAALISISHHNTLDAFHTHVVQVNPAVDGNLPPAPIQIGHADGAIT
jgi:vitamin B12/bleomycin/antimicrobial peptide transport system ATP-binding/permease protein